MPLDDNVLARFLPALFLAGAANGFLNSALGQQAVATLPDGRSGGGSAIGITVGAILIAHGAEVGGDAGMIAGWNQAVIATGLFSLLGMFGVVFVREHTETK